MQSLGTARSRGSLPVSPRSSSCASPAGAAPRSMRRGRFAPSGSAAEWGNMAAAAPAARWARVAAVAALLLECCGAVLASGIQVRGLEGERWWGQRASGAADSVLLPGRCFLPSSCRRSSERASPDCPWWGGAPPRSAPARLRCRCLGVGCGTGARARAACLEREKSC